ncbi:MAG: hypothetical protein E5X61_33775, partial [Mesorhizobium sp.]
MAIESSFKHPRQSENRSAEHDVTSAANSLSSSKRQRSMRRRPVQRRLEKEWELSIGPDTVRLFIL